MWMRDMTGERRKRGKGDRRATELTTVIQNCLEQTIMLELMAGSQIDIFVQVLQVGMASCITGSICECFESCAAHHVA